MEKITLKIITPAEAEKAMKAAGLGDFERGVTPASIAAAGQAFEVQNETGKGIFVAEKKGSEFWVHGAASCKSTGLLIDGIGVGEALAKQAGCTRIAFKTNRPGLVKVTKKFGYKVVAFIVEKRI